MNSRTSRGGRGGRSNRHQLGKRRYSRDNGNAGTATMPKRSNNDEMTTPPTRCTANAVRTMLLAEPYTGPLTVYLCIASPVTRSVNDYGGGDDCYYVESQICDDSLRAHVWVPDNLYSDLQVRNSLNNNNFAIINVKGYVTSTVNSLSCPLYPTFQPILCITRFEDVATPARPNQSWHQVVAGKQVLLNHQQQNNNNNNNDSKVKGGTSAAFVHAHIASLSDQVLMGHGRMEVSTPVDKPQHERDFLQNQSIVQDFLKHHKAMKTLQESNLMIHHSGSSIDDVDDSLKAPPNTNNNSNSSNTNSSRQAQQPQKQQHELYFAALREFADSQIDRQNTSLTSNSGKATASDAAKVVVQYKETLNQVLTECENPTLEPWITTKALKRWHGVLCGNGLHARAGRFRINTVRAGRTVFCPPEEVSTSLESYLGSLHTMEKRLKQCPSTETAGACMTYAAAVFFGIVDVHAFSDGNGRLARLLSNGALKALGLPFCINWFATPAQRHEYVLALITTRRNLTLVYRGEDYGLDSEHASIRQVLAATGIYFPLVALLMNLVRKAIPEFVQLQHNKQLTVMEHEEAIAARRARERAAAGSCLICFDDNPNIATLCCGKPIHLACIAQWLSSNSSCPNCRGDFPALPQRPARLPAQQGLGADNEERSSDNDTDEMQDTEVDEDDDDTTSVFGHLNIFLNNQNAAVEVDNDSEDTEDDTTSDTTLVVVPANHQRQAAEAEDNTEDTTMDETTAVLANNNYNNRQDSADDTTTDDTTNDGTETTAAIHASNQVIHEIRCLHCRNRAAQECTNSCCGQCCVLYGNWECPRHGQA